MCHLEKNVSQLPKLKIVHESSTALRVKAQCKPPVSSARSPFCGTRNQSRRGPSEILIARPAPRCVCVFVCPDLGFSLSTEKEPGFLERRAEGGNVQDELRAPDAAFLKQTKRHSEPWGHVRGRGSPLKGLRAAEPGKMWASK